MSELSKLSPESMTIRPSVELKQIPLALAVFTGAGLLFLIQPIVAKQLLPVFGGVASVWIGCLLFFQAILLIGYIYAHLLRIWCEPKLQGLVHLALVAVACMVGYLGREVEPAAVTSPIFALIFVLTIKIGLPAMLVAATSPLVQHWYGLQFEQPYRLYALSNLASLIALLSYPVLLEPNIALSDQYTVWLLGLGVYCLVCAVCASNLISVVRGSGSNVLFSATVRSRFWWIALSFGGSMMLLATTNVITREVAPIPLLWILPLALYLITFMLVFNNDVWSRPPLLVPAFLLSMVGLLAIQSDLIEARLAEQLVIYSSVLFLGCLACHGELARMKPKPEGLTEFYLFLAVGGLLGSVFVNLIAPVLFSRYYEFEIGVVFITILALAQVAAQKTTSTYFRWQNVLGVLFVLGLCSFFLNSEIKVMEDELFADRGFYGSVQVSGRGLGHPGALHDLRSDGVAHGSEFIDEKYREVPNTYYSIRSGIGLVLLNLKREQRRVGVVGLGAGTLATYGRRGDQFHFFEISPVMEEIARNFFFYLDNSKAAIEIINGDARLSLAQQRSDLVDEYDVLVIDAFNGDAIPFHLLTEEAWQLYWNRLVADGVLAVHVSNKYLDLLPVILHLNQSDRKGVLTLVENENDAGWDITASSWVVVTDNPQILDAKSFNTVALVPPLTNRRVRWTDELSSVLSLVSW